MQFCGVILLLLRLLMICFTLFLRSLINDFAVFVCLLVGLIDCLFVCFFVCCCLFVVVVCLFD